MVKFQSGLSNSAALRAPVGLYLPTSKSPRFLFAMQVTISVWTRSPIWLFTG